MIGIVIPAHNEEALLDSCLTAARTAATHPALLAEPVRIMVVLDACTDDSAAIAGRHRVDTAQVDAMNVGHARAHGAQRMLAAGARWLAFTDADTLVAPDWLAAQLGVRADVVCGTVDVTDWREHPRHVWEKFRSEYCDRDGHGHIHGANFGISAEAYLRCGGFKPLACHEDVDLVRALQATDATIAWSAAPRVTTSARLASKSRGGFGDTLRSWAQPAILPPGA
ncbi:glycosyltransferase family 2 protein [Herbaspirillum sp. LeCh32-8]|uniref:glycosyltransferase n=1 Tax=Herbaspirillum sp. LeCh32-8 TaxID=2821356 RepID=UPI001AE1057E|nr:glycosyltransferase family A protein [Herbaspirillum sp. LeCh32-8]MBP0600643.1 glycosyltransferase family 2 protein [Herbaspirillum sp. LeCh32-8]